MTPSASPTACSSRTSCPSSSSAPRTSWAAHRKSHPTAADGRFTLPMTYRQDIAGCFAETVGQRGVTSGELDAMLARAKPALATLNRRRDDGSLPMLRLPAQRDDLAALANVADEFRRRFDHVLVLGIGGSSLGGQTLCALADQGFGPRPGAPRLDFMENIDPASFAALFAALDPERSGVIAISKSGGTAETLAQLVVTIDCLRQALGKTDIGDRIVALTEPRDSPLSRLAMRRKLRLLDHDHGIDGRYRVLSNVG